MSKTTKQRTLGDQCLAHVDLAVCAVIAADQSAKDACKLACGGKGERPGIKAALEDAALHSGQAIEQLHDARADLAGALVAAGVPCTPRKGNRAGRRVLATLPPGARPRR